MDDVDPSRVTSHNRPPSRMAAADAARRPYHTPTAPMGVAFKNQFKGVHGDSLTRPPRGFDAEHKLIDEIKRKSFFAMAQGKPAATKKPAFVDEVAATFADAKPLMKFLCDALGAPIWCIYVSHDAPTRRSLRPAFKGASNH